MSKRNKTNGQIPMPNFPSIPTSNTEDIDVSIYNLYDLLD